MTVKDNEDCYGCGLCAVICNKDAIKIELSPNGFYEPHLDEKKCVDCGLCSKTCAYNFAKRALEAPVLRSFAAWSNDTQTRKECTSGGAAYELAKTALTLGYKVCGVRYNGERNVAEHYVASSLEELLQSKGSKYIQSYTVDGFRSINKNDKYLVVGTPCQIDSFRRFIRLKRIGDNFILVDVYCHGVASMFIWQKYVSCLEQHIGKVYYASWRNKVVWKDGFAENDYDEKANEVYTGWHDSYNIIARGENGKYQKRHSQGNPFFKFFMAEDCLGKACYTHCKYRYDNSSADIRIGDMWGEEYRENKDGVNCIITFTEKGLELVKQTNCELKEYPFKIAAEGQHRKSPKIKLHDDVIHCAVTDPNISFDDMLAVLLRQRRKHIYREWIKHPIRTMKDVIRWILKPIRKK